uniref:Arm DNA-binding domain-containing protein n=1 Tax=Pseudomonas chlororaphis TaxID=587753 RepID=UPI00358DC0E0
MPPTDTPDNAPVFRRKLNDTFVRSLTEPGKHADGEVLGLYLEVRASSKAGKSPSKFWRLKYRLHGKENRFSIGAYPDIGLKEARVRGRAMVGIQVCRTGDQIHHGGFAER